MHQAKPREDDAPPLAWRVPQFCKAVGICKSTFWKLRGEGKIKTVAIGGRTLVPHDEVSRLLSEGTK